MIDNLLDSGNGSGSVTAFVETMKLKTRIRVLLRELGITQTALAAKIGMTVQTLNRRLAPGPGDIALSEAMSMFEELGVHPIDAWGYIHLANMAVKLLDDPYSLPDADFSYLRDVIDELKDGGAPFAIAKDLGGVVGWSMAGIKYVCGVVLHYGASREVEAIVLWLYASAAMNLNKLDTAESAFSAAKRWGLPEPIAGYTECSLAQMYQERGDYGTAWGKFKSIMKKRKETMDATMRTYVGLFGSISEVHGFDDWISDEDEVTSLKNAILHSESYLQTLETHPEPARRRSWWLGLSGGYVGYIDYISSKGSSGKDTMLSAMRVLKELTTNDESNVRARARNALAHLYVVIGSAFSYVNGPDVRDAQKFFDEGKLLAEEDNYHFVLELLRHIRRAAPLLLLILLLLASSHPAFAGDACQAANK